MSALDEVITDRRVARVEPFNDVPPLQRITRFQAWALLDVLGVPRDPSITLRDAVRLLEKVSPARLQAAAHEVGTREMAAMAARAGEVAHDDCIICGNAILDHQPAAVGAKGKFHTACARAEAPVAAAAPAAPPLEPPPLEKMNVFALRKVAKARGHSVSLKATRAELLALLAG